MKSSIRLKVDAKDWKSPCTGSERRKSWTLIKAVSALLKSYKEQGLEPAVVWAEQYVEITT